MKIITLAAPTLVGGVVRNPIEGAFTVDDDEAARLNEGGLLAVEPEDIADEADAADEGGEDDLDAMTLPELGIIVTKEGVPLNGATKKADIIAAIEKHREGQAG
jgi:hypothetical protein